MTALPSGWSIQTVKDLLPIRYGKSLAANLRVADGKYPVVGSAGEMARTDQSLINGATIVVGRKGNVGAVQLLIGGGWPIDTTYYSEVPVELDPRFVAHQLIALRLVRLDSSTATPSLRRQDYEVQELVVPPLYEQRRIVDILEDHLSRLDAAERYLAAADERENHLQMGLLAVGLHGQLVQEDLNEGTGQDLVRRCGGDPSAFVLGDEDRAWPVPSSWAWTRIADVFEVYVGATPSRADKSLWGGDLAWVSSGEVAFNRITSTRETVQLAAVGNSLTRIHEPGTVMLAMIGEGKTRGQAAILGVTAAHNQNCASIRVARTPVLSEYVFYFLRERYIETRRVASGGNQPALNKGVIGRIAIPIPPLGTQRRLIAAFQEADESGDGLRRAIRESRARAGLLRNSLLTAAFSGRLTGRSTDMEMVEEMAGV